MKINLLFKNNLVKNGTWLYILQFFNTVIPLITLPLITRNLGPTLYGDFSYAFVIIGYFKIVIDFGFDFTGTRKISLLKHDKFSVIFSNIFWAKILFTFASFFLILLVVFMKLFSINYLLLIILSLILLGSSFQQNWFFHGIQEMKFISIINIFSRSLTTLLIFIYIKEPSDIYLFAFLFSLNFIITAILSSILIFLKHKVYIKRPSLKGIIEEIKEGSQIFLITIMTKIIISIGILILGANNLFFEVGILSVFQKIPLLLITIFTPISQVFFPYLSVSYSKDFYSTYNKIIKFSVVFFIFLLLATFILSLFSYPLLDLIFGIDYSSVWYLSIPLVFWSLFSIINNILGYQILVASGNQSIYLKTFFIIFMVSIFLNLFLFFSFGFYGIILSPLLIELLFFILLAIRVKELKKQKPSNSLLS
jgi:PST family polysaccharide transporter